MGLNDWLVESVQRYHEQSLARATKRTGQELWKGVLRRLPNPSGKVIWQRDWDVLVVLDACRYDVFEQSYGTAAWLDSVESVRSVGSSSPEWMDNTFHSQYREELSQTVYVTGNPHSRDHLSSGLLSYVDEVWQDTWDDNLGTIRPESITARAVQQYRERTPERLIVHYMQPHWPYVSNPVMDGFYPETVIGDGSTSNPFDRQNIGVLSREEHLKRYRENLHHVVEHLRETLLVGINAEKVVLTADHGELFGEYGLYKHPGNIPLPAVRRVPWAETSASAESSYDIPVEAIQSDTHDRDRQEQLRDLGYLE